MLINWPSDRSYYSGNGTIVLLKQYVILLESHDPPPKITIYKPTCCIELEKSIFKTNMETDESAET